MNAPAAAARLLVASAASDRDDRWCLNRIAGAAAVRPTSGRFNKSCDQAIAWLQALIEARRGMKKPRNDWIAAASFMSDNLLGLLLCLRYSYRKENRAMFKLMCKNYGVHSAASLAPLVADALFDGRLWSGIYQVFNFRKTPRYHGKFHGSESWSCWERCKNHFAQMIAAKGNMSEVQDMYRYMARKGGLEEWFILPIMRCPEIPKCQLDAIEQRYIRADPHCLNTQHFKGKGASRGCARPHCKEVGNKLQVDLQQQRTQQPKKLRLQPMLRHLARRG